jgi:hypothetical protein
VPSLRHPHGTRHILSRYRALSRYRSLNTSSSFTGARRLRLILCRSIRSRPLHRSVRFSSVTCGTGPVPHPRDDSVRFSTIARYQSRNNRRFRRHRHNPLPPSARAVALSALSPRQLSDLRPIRPPRLDVAFPRADQRQRHLARGQLLAGERRVDLPRGQSSALPQVFSVRSFCEIPQVPQPLCQYGDRRRRRHPLISPASSDASVPKRSAVGNSVSTPTPAPPG